jgi:hypothetical protein
MNRLYLLFLKISTASYFQIVCLEFAVQDRDVAVYLTILCVDIFGICQTKLRMLE